MFHRHHEGCGLTKRHARRLIPAVAAGYCLSFLLVVNAWAGSTVLPDTGQTACYDNDKEIVCPLPGEAFYGQDANYQGEGPAYRNDGDTVTDLVTGLVWQQADDGVSRNWDDAATYCQDLDLGGYADWRMPSIKELLSIVDAGRFYPAFNPVFTSTTSTAYYWSGTPFASSSSQAWHVGAYAGVSNCQAKTLPDRIRCVRGGPMGTPSYVDNGNDTVTDRTTGLMWEKTGSDAGMSWEAALARCEAAETGGYADWRLPNKRELEFLVDVSRYDPSIDLAFTKLGNLYWTGTTYVQTGYLYEAWRVNFTDGSSREYGKSVSFYARCVRGGPASFSPGVLNFILQDGE